MGQISNGAPEGGEKKGLAAGLFMPAADWEKRTQRLLVLAFQVQTTHSRLKTTISPSRAFQRQGADERERRT